jgi:hypothetical protein
MIDATVSELSPTRYALEDMDPGKAAVPVSDVLAVATPRTSTPSSARVTATAG